MGYNYYNYLVFIDASVDPTALFEELAKKLAKFSTSRRADTLTISIDDWKLFVHYSAEPHVIIEAAEIGERYNKPALSNAPARLEIYAEDDPEMEYFNDVFYLLELIDELKGTSIFDPVSGTFTDKREEKTEAKPKLQISARDYSVYDDGGFMAIVDTAAYQGFVSEDWELDQIMDHFTAAMNDQHMIIWQANNDGGSQWNVSLLDAEPDSEAFRQFERTIMVTNGMLHLCGYDDLTMAAQFEDQKLPSKQGQKLFFKLENGLYNICVRQLFDPGESNSNEDEEADFEITISAAQTPSAPAAKVIWSTL